MSGGSWWPCQRLFLVRHGTARNPDGLVYGRLPGYPLAPRGRGMADAAARRLSRFDLDLVVSSPQDRTLQTATPIADASGRFVHCDERLSEVLNHREGLAFVPATEWAPPSKTITLLSPYPFPGAAETQAEIRWRMAGAAASALQRAVGDVVLVSHQVPLAVLVRFLGAGEDAVPDIGEGSVTMVGFDGERWRIGPPDGSGAPVGLPPSPHGLLDRLLEAAPEERPRGAVTVRGLQHAGGTIWT